MTEQFTNGAQTTLNGAINSAVTSLVVTSAAGFPTTGDFRIIVAAEGANKDEILLVTAVSGTTFTVTRAYEAISDGTQVAQSHANGATVAHVLTAGSLRAAGLPQGFIGVAAYKSSDLAMSTSGEANLTMDAEVWDTDGFHDNSTNNQRFTVPAGLGGKYHVTLHVRIDANADAYVIGRKNGSAIVVMAANARYVSSSFSTAHDSADVDLAAGDYIEFKQLSGSAANIKTSGGMESWASMVKLDSGKIGSGIGASVFNSTTQSISSATNTPLTFDSEHFDTDGFHSTSSNTSRLTIPAGLGGKYLVTGSTYVNNSDPDGNRILAVKKNGADVPGGYSRIPGNALSEGLNVSVVLDLSASNYVELYVYQDSGSSLDFGFGSANNAQSQFSIMRLDSTPMVQDVPIGFIGAKAYNNNVQSVNSGTIVPLTLNSEDWDTDGFHSTSTNTARFTIPAGLGGKYLVVAHAWGSFTVTNVRYLSLYKNGSATAEYRTESSSTASSMPMIEFSNVFDFVAGDYFEMNYEHDNGSAQNVGHASARRVQTEVMLVKLDSGKVGSGIGAQAIETSNQTISSGAAVAVTFNDTDTYDTDGFHDTSTNTSRLTIPTGLGGIYAFGGMGYLAGTTGFRELQVRLNGTTILTQDRHATSSDDNTIMTVNGQHQFVPGDYIELMLRHDAGADRTLTNASIPARFWIARLDSGASGVRVIDEDGTPAVNTRVIRYPKNTVVALGNGEVYVRDAPQAFIGVQAVRSSAQSLSAGGDAVIAFNADDTWDTDGFHDPSTNNSRITIPAGLGGKYRFSLNVAIAVGSGAYRYAQFKKNGSIVSTPLLEWIGGASFTNAHMLQHDFDLVAGDYIEVNVGTADTVNLTAAYLSVYKLDSGKVGGGIGARVYHNANQSINNTTSTAIAFNDETAANGAFDTDGFHSTSTNNTRMTIPAGLGGIYLIIGQASFEDASVTGVRALNIKKNGTTVLAEMDATPHGDFAPYLEVTTIAQLVAGDYVEIFAYHSAGVAKNIVAVTGYSPVFSIARLDSGSNGPGPWTDFTPTWTSAGTAPALGNGTLTGRYMLLGAKTCMVRIELTTGSTTTYGSSNFWTWALPFTAASRQQVMTALTIDISTRYDPSTALIASGGTTINTVICARTATQLALNAPHTWASGDGVIIEGIYEIA